MPSGDTLIRFLVNWGGLLEPIEMPAGCCIADLADYTESAGEAPSEHRLFIFKGLLLHPAARLNESGVRDNAVLHMVINDDPYKGRPLHIKDSSGAVRTVYCGADFYIEDVKEELSCIPGEPPPEKIRLVFAGRELQNQHTLREYNVQKPSVLLSVKPGASGREIENFVQQHEPRANQMGVPVTSSVSVSFNPPDHNDSHFWGQMLGGPEFSSITTSELLVKACLGTEVPVQGRVSYDPNRSLVVFTPTQQLKPATRYKVTLNPLSTKGDGKGNIEHSRVREKMHGEVAWDFFTTGYQPLRVTGVYPRPHSRVRCDTAALVITFSGPLHPSCEPEQWLTVRGHDLKKPLLDLESNSLVYTFADPLLPNEICRVRLREQLVRGAGGESLFPCQQDGLLKTSTFRWKFYSAEVSLYEDLNLASSGVEGVLDRVTLGGTRPLGPPVYRGDYETGPGFQAALPSPGGGGRFSAAEDYAPGGRGTQGRLVGPDDGPTLAPPAQAIVDWLNPSNLIGQLTQDQAGGQEQRPNTRGQEWRF